MLVKRHLLLFFRDKANVFFSMLAIFIIIGLFVLFLGDTMVEAIQANLDHPTEDIRIVVAGLMLGATVAVTSITSCQGALGISVGDKEGPAYDFFSSPISRRKIALSYIASSTIVGIIMTGFSLLLVMAYMMFLGAGLPSLAIWGKLLLTLLLSTLCANSMLYLLTLFVKSKNALAALGSIVGTMVGFLMGIYLPIGQLPTGVGWFIRLFPMSHAASMFRQLLADDHLTRLFAGAPPESLQSLRVFFGVTFVFGEFQSGFWFSAGVLAVTTVLFYAISLAVIQTRKPRS